MAKASKTRVKWLKPGERGWVEDHGWRWKWDGKQMWYQDGGSDMRWWETTVGVDRIEVARDCTEVFPRPAPRRKAKAVRSAVSWAVLDPQGKPYGARPTRDGATRLKERGDDSVVRCTINYRYTPKSKGAKR